MTGLFLVRSPPARIEPQGFLGGAAAGRHDLALLQERIGDRYRLIEQSARIVAQVDNEALELVAGLGGEVGDRFLEALGGLLVEGGDADKADGVAFEARTHRAHLDARAGDGNLDRLVLALAHDLEFDLGVLRAAHLFDRLIEGEPLKFPELRPHAVASGFPFDQELAPAACSTNEGKAEKVEGFRWSHHTPIHKDQQHM
jgi:hypothetical protein